MANDESTKLMMHVTPIIVSLCLFSACLTNAQVKSDREQDDLSGSVHTVRTEKIMLAGAGDKTTDQKTEIAQVTYNEKGNKTEETKYKPDGSLLNKSIFGYDTAGNRTAVTVYNADSSVYLKRVFSYSKTFGRIRIEESAFKSGTILLSRTTYAYDNKGRVTDFSTFDTNGKPEMRIVTTYHDNGNPAEVDYFQDYNSQTGKAVFAYDAQGNLMREDIYGADGSQSSKLVFSGDTKRGADITITEYDSKENLVSKERYIREFDSYGNWMKETKSKLNIQSGAWETVEVTQRKITYY